MSEPSANDASPAQPRARPRWRRWAWPVVRLALLTIILLAVGVSCVEQNALFQPTVYPEGPWDEVKRSELPIEDITLETIDSVEIHAWWVPHPDAMLTVLHFHGNAGNLAGRLHWVETLHNIPVNVLAIDYRGYGKSEGRPTERGLYRDGDAAWRWLTEEQKIAPEQIVVVGRSLGGAVACDLAARRPCRKLVMWSAFTSLHDMGDLVTWRPLTWLMRYDMNNLEKIKGVEVPVIVAHGTDDKVAPYAMGLALYEAARQPKLMLTFEGVGHIGLSAAHRERLIEAILAPVDKAPPKTAGEPPVR